jgi:Zn-dependent protease with chaperone function
MSDPINFYRTGKESLYDAALCIIGAALWAALIYALANAESQSVLSFVPLAVYIFAFIIFFVVSALLFRANAMGNMILISQDQFPHLHEMVRAGAQKLNIQVPEAFLYNSNGAFNAFARQIFGRKYLLLTSSIVEGVTDEQINFVIGHELGHHAAGHLNFLKYLLRFPARIVPFLHMAYSRQCEYTCDSIGLYVSRDVKHSCEAIQMLGCGCQKLNTKLNLEAFVKQEDYVPAISGFFNEILRSHPRLTRRVLQIEKTKILD